MSSQLLEIEPEELKFIVELKKQSSCSVRLFNKSKHCVAYKVKTTSPKKYSVRPNIGIIEPKSACDFVVTMQAPRTTPPDMMCKDKFLIQSTFVPVGTTEDEITSSLFNTEGGGYVEERKLRVILASPPHSPVLSPMNGVHNNAPVYDSSMLKGHVQQKDSDPGLQPHISENIEFEVENGKPPLLAKAFDVETEKELKKLELVESIENNKPKASEPEITKDVEDLEMVKDTENMNSKISELELKLQEAEVTISKLIEERMSSLQQRESLRRELALLSSSKGMKKIQAGFPFLFVCMVALVSTVVGYLLR